MDFTIRLTGTSGILMHNARLSNPLDPAAKTIKKVSGKRNKTDEDHAEMARLEFFGGMYFDKEVGPYIPADNIWRALYDAAKKTKRGPKIKEGVFIATDVNPLSYGNGSAPRTESGLWADESYRFLKSAKVAQVRVTRCRPLFPEGWTVEADGVLDENVIDFAELESIADTAGSLVGLGDWRPRFGRFTAEVIKSS